MKRVKNILILCLAVVMVAGLLAGCGESTADKVAALSGKWTMTVTDPEAQAVLEAIDLYEEEIALADLTALQYVQTVEFDAELNYSFGYDMDATKELLRQFYNTTFDALYEGRTSLNAVYEMEFDAATKEEFLQFYADLYGSPDYETLINDFVENAYDYTVLSEPFETGTYTIRGNAILCTITGETEAESLGYAIDGDTLTLTYVDGEEVYTKAN